MLKIYKKINNIQLIINEKFRTSAEYSKVHRLCLGLYDTIIVLEDDHITPEFFSFCDYMLEKFASNEKIFQISGSCYLPYQLKKMIFFFQNA